MRIALVTIDYPPRRSSAAVQMRDLAAELVAQGHEPVVIVPDETLDVSWTEESVAGVTVLRLAAPGTRGFGHLQRAIREVLLPFAMLRALRKSPFRRTRWDGLVWYSPTIFFGPLIWSLQRRSGCRSYLILRDIFPEWSLDLGLIRRGPTYVFFKAVARFQYSVADVIGVQTSSNLPYLAHWASASGRRLEVLKNWLASAPDIGSSITIAETVLAGRKIFIYIGNMGVAQGMDIFIELADRLRDRQDLGFLFVGRGTAVPRLEEMARARSLENTVFHEEVEPSEMPGLLSQCHVGLLALEPSHRTHNIPGKFLTYLQAGLPILARVNRGTDLAGLIEREGIGRAYVGDSVEAFRSLAEELADDVKIRQRMALNGRSLASRMFSPDAAVRQVVAALSGEPVGAGPLPPTAP